MSKTQHAGMPRLEEGSVKQNTEDTSSHMDDIPIASVSDTARQSLAQHLGTGGPAVAEASTLGEGCAKDELQL